MTYIYETINPGNYLALLEMERNYLAARNAKICLMRDEHKTLQQIGDEFNLSRQRVFQILKRHQPHGAE